MLNDFTPPPGWNKLSPPVVNPPAAPSPPNNSGLIKHAIIGAFIFIAVAFPTFQLVLPIVLAKIAKPLLTIEVTDAKKNIQQRELYYSFGVQVVEYYNLDGTTIADRPIEYVAAKRIRRAATRLETLSRTDVRDPQCVPNSANKPDIRFSTKDGAGINVPGNERLCYFESLAPLITDLSGLSPVVFNWY